MKKWMKPELEILKLNMTFAGAGIRTPDDTQPDQDEMVHYS